jgi:hypothetical protein
MQYRIELRGRTVRARPVIRLGRGPIGILAPVRVTEAAELVAIDVLEQAEKTGQRVTLAMVEHHIRELLAHPPAWGCGRC